MIVRFTILLGIASGALFANSFINGGFEDPILIASPDFSTVPTGWVKVDPTGVGLFMELYSSFGLPTLGGEGNQAFGFGGNGTTSGSLSQTFDTIAGTDYQVSFQYVIQQGPEFEDLNVAALDGATTLSSNDIRFNNTAWITSTLSFTATSSSTTLQFSDTTGAVDPGTGFSTNWALDAVSVTGQGTPGIPEPSSLALAGLGILAAIGWRLREVSGRAMPARSSRAD